MRYKIQLEQAEEVKGDYIVHRFANVRKAYKKGDLSLNDVIELAEHTHWYANAPKDVGLASSLTAAEYLEIIDQGWRVDIS